MSLEDFYLFFNHSVTVTLSYYLYFNVIFMGKDNTSQIDAETVLLSHTEIAHMIAFLGPR